MIVASPRNTSRFGLIAQSALVGASVLALFALAPAGNTAERYLEQARHGNGGKEAAARFIWHTLDDDAASVAFGKGPAETVSRAAFMSIPGYANSSVFSSLGLGQARVAQQVEDAVSTELHGDTPNSTNSGVSSTLGVLGDLGIFGLVAYLGLAVMLLLRVRRDPSPEGVAATAGLALVLF